MLNLIGACIAVGALIVLCHYYWREYSAPDDERSLGRFWAWVIKGLVVPLISWTALNADLGAWFPPLTADVHFARTGGGNWIEVLAQLLAPGWTCLGSCWAATTFVWLLAPVRIAPGLRTDFLAAGVFWGLILLPVVWIILRFCDASGLAMALLVWLWPVAHFTLPLIEKKAASPSYSRAVARMKFGKYADAEWEVIAQLEKCTDDFDGWMMLADLYANHFHDLAVADQTILDLCDQPNVTSVQVAIAWHRLADWHLKLANDPDGARWAMEEICARLPGTTFAREARQRLNRLPANRAAWLEQREEKPIHLPPLKDDLEETEPAPESELDRSESLRRVNECVAKLKQDPNDVPAREKLAWLLAERLNKPELGIEQLELLMGIPEQPPQKAAQWLGQIAAWQIKFRKDWTAAKSVLERLIHEFPQTPQAFSAQRRLNLIEMELQIRKAGQHSAALRSSL